MWQFRVFLSLAAVVVFASVGIVKQARLELAEIPRRGAPQRPPAPIPQQRGGSGWFGNDVATVAREARPDETRFPRAIEVSIRALREVLDREGGRLEPSRVEIMA